MEIIEPIDTLPSEELEERIHRTLLEKQLMYVFHNSGFYREKFSGAGIGLDDIGNLKKFETVPYTEKREILEEQVRHAPFGRLAVGPERISRVHITSGTTGQPQYIALTQNDVAANMISGRRAFQCAGVCPGDVVVHCLNYCLWAGGLTDHLSLEAAQATVVPFGVGSTRKLIETIRELKVNAISCTPSYLSKLEALLRDEFGISPRELGLKKGFFGGEAGLQDPNFRSGIESLWGLRAIDANYGMADVLSIFGSECGLRDGLHFHGRGILYPELRNPETGFLLSLNKGNEGELVLTNLTREAQPLVRYRTGDIVRIVDHEPCGCGRRSFRFLVIGRADQMFVVQGINVFPEAVHSLLLKNMTRFSGFFEIVLETPPPFWLPLLRVESQGTRAETHDGVDSEFLVKACQETLSFTPRVEIVPFGKLPRTEGKTRYIRRTYGP